ncbi:MULTISPECIES: hypothetical protein [unclassified Pseudomonas]|uniref:hypothetical protein n=1 Tax=unclassified Pseudomonas TaxID=196821 RepID=UPI002449F6D0|nr:MULTISPECIES: hypothetical protein [unclassified Pseudomonas]MDG9928508.1 hypothetical protein [Pseudomonas sp. GD04042]MDH0482678.1 hypothetical protein [Pseudomonas sp. GD04015]MDH0604620.1 hypothetical protein [Pseudomonas sp. GD03869]
MRQQTLLLPAVTLDIRFADLLGDKMLTISTPERRARWAEWLRLARAAGSAAVARAWSDNRDCQGCKHLRGAWCRLQELPCTVNPALSYRTGLPGLACCGAGREEHP